MKEVLTKQDLDILSSGKGNLLKNTRYMECFVIRTSLVHAHNLLPKAISKCLISSLLILLLHDNFLTLISLYIPTLDYDESVEDEFYWQLNELISSITPRNKLIILGNFNTWVGNDTATWSPVIRNKRHRNCNDKRLCLLGICSEHKLLITNIIFPTQQKTTWRHPWSETMEHPGLFHYSRERPQRCPHMLHPKDNDCWMDYWLPMCKLSIQTCRHPCIIQPAKWKFDRQKLTDPNMAREYVAAVKLPRCKPLHNKSQKSGHHFGRPSDTWKDTSKTSSSRMILRSPNELKRNGKPKLNMNPTHHLND